MFFISVKNIAPNFPRYIYKELHVFSNQLMTKRTTGNAYARDTWYITVVMPMHVSYINGPLTCTLDFS